MEPSNNEKQPVKKKEDPKATKYYIKTENSVMNEIQEILTDQDIVKKKLIEENKDYYILELIFPEEITQKNFKIKFLLMISKEYPKIEPELYCLTVFCHPHICDGRNLINNIIDSEWSSNKLPLEIIINKIPKFIIKYNEYKDNSNDVGKYVLDKYYKINFLKELPIYFHLVSKDNKILTISDISLCLYDLDKNIGYCKLSFHVDLKNLIEVKSKKKKNLITIKYKDSLNNKKNKISINTPNNEAINAILQEKMKIYQKKSGKLPDIKISKVEKEIEEKEKELKDNNTDMEKNLYLMSLYQEAVEYYSAINNPKFIEITNKIHNLLRNSDNLIIEASSNKKDEQKNEPNITNKEEIKENNAKNVNINIKEEQKDNEKEEKKNTIEGNEAKENTNTKDIKKEEKKDKEETKQDNKSDKKEEKNNNKIDNKTEIKNKNDIDKSKENKKEKKDNIKENKKEEKQKKDNKEDKKKQGLRLKIDEGELGTLDVGDEEDEEEEEDEK